MKYNKLLGIVVALMMSANAQAGFFLVDGKTRGASCSTTTEEIKQSLEKPALVVAPVPLKVAEEKALKAEPIAPVTPIEKPDFTGSFTVRPYGNIETSKPVIPVNKAKPRLAVEFKNKAVKATPEQIEQLTEFVGPDAQNRRLVVRGSKAIIEVKRKNEVIRQLSRIGVNPLHIKNETAIGLDGKIVVFGDDHE